MTNNVSIVLVGIGGYGGQYVKQLLDNQENRSFTIAGAVDPYPEKSPYQNALAEAGVALYRSLEEFYEHGHADLAVISSPIQFHCEQACIALQKGSHVLCEKPISATVQEAQEMMKVRDQTGRFLAIGYQWSHSQAILELKQDMMSGTLGKPAWLKSIVLWPRDKAYYSRGWAAKQKDDQGRWILDSVANNATAHYLHNMFYVLGSSMDRSASLKHVTAELYRANPIENFDTAAIRACTTEDIEVLFIASHATGQSLGPKFEFCCEKATVFYDNSAANKQIEALFADGTRKCYGDPFAAVGQYNKLWAAIDAAAGQSVNLPCGVEAALTHTICINLAQDSMKDIVTFPDDMIKEDDKSFSVPQLYAALVDCYQDRRLPSEASLPWAQPGLTLEAAGYDRFR